MRVQDETTIKPTNIQCIGLTNKKEKLKEKKSSARRKIRKVFQPWKPKGRLSKKKLLSGSNIKHRLKRLSLK